MVAFTSLRDGSPSTVTVALQLPASRVRSWPTLEAMPCRPVFTRTVAVGRAEAVGTGLDFHMRMVAGDSLLVY